MKALVNFKLLKKSNRIVSCILLVAALLSSSMVIGQEAKFSFSNTPFGESGGDGKQSFKTSEFIYGRVELSSTIEEFFKMPQTSKNLDYPTSVLRYEVSVEKDGEVIGGNSWPYMRVSNAERKSKYLNFDVLPNPTEATTIICGGADFATTVTCAPLYSMFNRQNFPGNGTYIIKISFRCWTYDPYSKNNDVLFEEWIATNSGEFQLDFDVADLQLLQTNDEKADELVKENARLKKIKERGLPKEWNMKSAPIASGYTEKQLTDMMLAPEGPTCKLLKAYIYPVSGPSWIIAKDDYNEITFKWHNQDLGFFANNGGRCFYVRGGLRQTYEGGGTYGPTHFQFVESDEIDCKVIPKTAGN